MDLGPFAAHLLMLRFIAAVFKSRRRRRSRWGSGASAAIYDLLIEDKRKAIEIIVEERAEERDPETADGNLPELESPTRK
jgi:hypothetical protein